MLKWYSRPQPSIASCCNAREGKAMADLTVIPANVSSYPGAQMSNGTSGEAILAGQTVYQDAADANKWKLFDANVTAKSVLGGVAMNSTPGAGQPITVLTSG